MGNPATDRISAGGGDRLACSPLIEEVREIDSGSHRDLYRRREPRIDLHQARDAFAVPPELDLGITLQVDLPDQSLRLAAGVGRDGDALAQNRFPSQRRRGALRPLREARLDLAAGID